MCTVTYLPLENNDFILTSNRDEDPHRVTVPPKQYTENGIAIEYPKDKVAGGTWIGLRRDQRLICLLNGGFVKHQRAQSYRMSRGLVVKQLLTAVDAVAAVEAFDFEGIEPFTIVLVDWQMTRKAYELVWDGEQKHFSKLEDEPRIWSSATLYTHEMKTLREQWFATWLAGRTSFEKSEIFAFHRDRSLGTPETAVCMKRTQVQTVSTTVVTKKGTQALMEYHPIEKLADSCY